MKAGKFYTKLFSKSLCVLLLVISACASGDDEYSPGWVPRTYQEPEPWREQQVELPAYPQKQDLLDTRISTDGLPYTVYLDPRSLARDDDAVMRYTVVIVSSSGVENVAYEGLHCGENTYRRYAYGINGAWQELADSPWLPITGRGVYRYRKLFYRRYMCDPANPVTDAEQILARIRSAWDVTTE